MFDFDGTLSPIVDDPAQARPLDGVVDRLIELGGRYRTVAVISGRPVDYLSNHLPPSVRLSGLYGLEAVVGGTRIDRPGVEPWRAVVSGAVEQAAVEGPAGMGVEGKGLSITLHFRTRPEIGPAVEAFAAEVARVTGLVVRSAKMSVELHPPVEADKGLAVRELAGTAGAALYVGDDVGDLPAFAALDDLRRQDRTTLAVAVGGRELPQSVRTVADLVLDGPLGVVGLMDVLLG